MHSTVFFREFNRAPFSYFIRAIVISGDHYHYHTTTFFFTMTIIIIIWLCTVAAIAGDIIVQVHSVAHKDTCPAAAPESVSLFAFLMLLMMMMIK